MPPPVLLSVIMMYLLSSKESDKGMGSRPHKSAASYPLRGSMGALRFNSLFSISLSFAFLVYMSEREREGYSSCNCCLVPCFWMCPWGLNNRPYLLIPVLSLHRIENKFKAPIKYVISVQKMCFYTFPLTLTQSLLLAHWSIFSSRPNCLKRMFWLMKFYILFCSQINAHYNSLHIFLILFFYLLLNGKEPSFIFQQLNWLNCLKNSF